MDARFGERLFEPPEQVRVLVDGEHDRALRLRELRRLTLDSRAHAQRETAIGRVHFDQRPRRHAPVGDQRRQRLRQHPVHHALELARAELLAGPVAEQQLACRGADRDVERPGAEPAMHVLLQLRHVVVEDVAERLLVERVVGDDDVDAVDELGRETPAHRAEGDRVQEVGRAPGRAARGSAEPDVVPDRALHLLGAEIARHEDQRLLEVNRRVVTQAQRRPVEDAEQQEDPGRPVRRAEVRLVHLDIRHDPLQRAGLTDDLSRQVFQQVASLDGQRVPLLRADIHGGDPRVQEKLEAQVRRLIDECWNKGNLKVIDEILTTDFVNNDPMDPSRGPEGAKTFVKKYRTAFPDCRIDIDEAISTNDKVVIRWHYSGTHRGQLEGIAPTGRRVNGTGLTIYHFQGDRIHEAYSNWDALTLMQQLGVVTLPGKSAQAGM